jgi:hypothetical protein
LQGHAFGGSRPRRRDFVLWHRGERFGEAARFLMTHGESWPVETIAEELVAEVRTRFVPGRKGLAANDSRRILNAPSLGEDQSEAPRGAGLVPLFFRLRPVLPAFYDQRTQSPV